MHKEIIAILSVFGVIAVMTGCVENKPSKEPLRLSAAPTVINEVPTQDSEPMDTAVDFDILSSQNIGGKALGDRLLSSYSMSELEALPEYKKMRTTVVVPATISSGQVKPTVNAIIKKMTTKDPDIDEIILFIYSDKSLIANPYDVATAIWAPRGELGHVDAAIASTNNRETYSTTIEIRDGFENRIKQNATEETKFGLSKNTRKKIYLEENAALDRSATDAERMCPIDPTSGTDDDYQRFMEKQEELDEKYLREICSKYGISKSTADNIFNEGLAQNWPTM